MAKLIKLEEVQKNTKSFYEACSNISILQRELEDMLVAIEKNSSDFEKGKISRDLFKYNEDRMKRESAKIIKSINDFVDKGVSVFDRIEREIESQKIVLEKKDRLKDIKKKIRLKTKKSKPKRKKKIVKAAEPAEAPAPVQAPVTEQKAEGV